jgi:hypothetical protein
MEVTFCILKDNMSITVVVREWYVEGKGKVMP